MIILLFFWILLFILFFIYFGYPTTLFLLTRIKGHDVTKREYFPNVTILIPAYNEEHVVRKTIENKLELNYPRNNFSICVISDGSTDRTDNIVKEYQSKGVRLLRQEKRQGKTAALNFAAKNINCDIIVFSDANSLYDKDALAHLVHNFADPQVGYVTGQMIYFSPDKSMVGEGCTMYMKYENYLRKLETKCGSIVGVDGGIDAIRKDLYQELPKEALPDFVLPLKVIEQGYRTVYEPNAILQEETLSSSKDEHDMRTRVSVRAFDTLYTMKHLLNPFKYGLFSYELLVHKLLRYLTGLILLLIFVINLSLLGKHQLYSFLFFLQIVFYLLALIGYLAEEIKINLSLINPIYYFCLLHYSSTIALLKYLKGEKKITWEPRKG